MLPLLWAKNTVFVMKNLSPQQMCILRPFRRSFNPNKFTFDLIKGFHLLIYKKN